MLKFFADESNDHDSSLFLAAGFLMTEPQAFSLEQDIKAILGPLPYFHMREGHAKQYPEIYSKLKKLIVRGRVLHAVAGSIREAEHKAILSHKVNDQMLSVWMGKPYTYLMGQTMRAATTAADQLKFRNSVKIEYIFEQGHPNQGDAEFFWGQLRKDKFSEMAASYRYGGHRFVDGKGADGSILQLCDLFCWHVRKNLVASEPLEILGREFRVPIYTDHHGAEDIVRSVKAGVDAWKRYGPGL